MQDSSLTPAHCHINCTCACVVQVIHNRLVCSIWHILSRTLYPWTLGQLLHRDVTRGYKTMVHSPTTFTYNSIKFIQTLGTLVCLFTPMCWSVQYFASFRRHEVQVSILLMCFKASTNDLTVKLCMYSGKWRQSETHSAWCLWVGPLEGLVKHSHKMYFQVRTTSTVSSASCCWATPGVDQLTRPLLAGFRDIMTQNDSSTFLFLYLQLIYLRKHLC